jgi:hypothetical protein
MARAWLHFHAARKGRGSGSAAPRVDWPVYPRRAEHNTVAEGGNRGSAETARQNAFRSRWPRADRGVGHALAAVARPLRVSGKAEDGWRVRWLGGCPARADRPFLASVGRLATASVEGVSNFAHLHSFLGVWRTLRQQGLLRFAEGQVSCGALEGVRALSRPAVRWRLETRLGRVEGGGRINVVVYPAGDAWGARILHRETG